MGLTFLIPTFETGCLAGLGLNPDEAPHATFSAWGEGRPAPTKIPIYHRWFFRTGSQGDYHQCPGAEKVMVAEEYYQGRLDWYNLDVDPAQTCLSDAGNTNGNDGDAESAITMSFFPTAIQFEGMPTHALVDF